MRTRILHEGARHLEYEIRQIVEVARQFESLGRPMVWENIGDPIAMGERVESWIVETVHELLHHPGAWAYCPTRGLLPTREFLAAEATKCGGGRVAPDDILFFNGVADAVDKVYYLIRKDARVILPTPCYPTHSSNETLRGDYQSIFFRLDPRCGWQPDLDELRLHVRYNPQIIAIAIVNPDNPTGLVYSREALLEIIEIARQHQLFLIVDEIYTNIRYNGAAREPIEMLIGDVPAIVLRGISKEYPWPGARCAWAEILNRDRDPQFAEYAHALFLAKMMEVCSTTLPQMTIPRIMGDSRYSTHLKQRAERFEQRANDVYAELSGISGLVVNRPQGAFYFTVLFEPGALNDHQTLPIVNPQLRSLVEQLTPNIPVDRRFVYYLMGAEGICVTPLSGFASSLPGFRITLLRADDAVRRDTLRRLACALRSYLAS